jgi:hypothetical protein
VRFTLYRLDLAHPLIEEPVSASSKDALTWIGATFALLGQAPMDMKLFDLASHALPTCKVAV